MIDCCDIAFACDLLCLPTVVSNYLLIDVIQFDLPNLETLYHPLRVQLRTLFEGESEDVTDRTSVDSLAVKIFKH